MLYVLGVASPTYAIDKIMYDSIKKKNGLFKNKRYSLYIRRNLIYISIFTCLDWFRGLKDKNGIDWFDNSIKATLANREYCINNANKFKTFNENSWGLTACVGPKGYSGGFGAMPALSDLEEQNDGTISPCGALGSIVFTRI